MSETENKDSVRPDEVCNGLVNVVVLLSILHRRVLLNLEVVRAVVLELHASKNARFAG